MRNLRTPWGAMVFAVLIFVASLASAEIYRWTDNVGKVHFTQDLGQVPPEHRAASKSRAAAPPGRNPIQHFTPPSPSPPARGAPLRSGARFRKAGKVHRIRVQRAGSSMTVMVRINDRLDVPFIIDTGATHVVIPLFAAEELGIAVEGPGVRTLPVSTANGVVEVPAVMLDSVQLGSARVDDVSGVVLKNMRMGLLGLAYFNHFTYNINAQTGEITLTENDLAEDGILRGGRARSQWTNSFRMMHRQLGWAEDQLKEVPFGRAREMRRAEEQLALYEERLQLLEAEADDAHVPFSWRD